MNLHHDHYIVLKMNHQMYEVKHFQLVHVLYLDETNLVFHVFLVVVLVPLKL